MQTLCLTHWAVALVTNPDSASVAPKLARQRAWAQLKAARGQTCRYPWLPAPRRADTRIGGAA